MAKINKKVSFGRVDALDFCIENDIEVEFSFLSDETEGLKVSEERLSNLNMKNGKGIQIARDAGEGLKPLR